MNSLIFLIPIVSAIVFYICYRIGKKAGSADTEKKRRIEAQRQIDLLAKASRLQSLREKSHENKIKKILSSDSKPSDISAMLSTYPSENKSTRAARTKKS